VAGVRGSKVHTRFSLNTQHHSRWDNVTYAGWMPNISFAGSKKRKTRHSGFTMSRQSSSDAEQSGRLLSLVDELLLNIIDHVDSHQALCNLAATCTRFQGIAEPYVWRSLLVLNGSQARNIALALDSRDLRIEYIRELSVRYKDEHRAGIEELNHFIPLMQRLGHLTIESPCPSMYCPGAVFVSNRLY